MEEEKSLEEMQKQLDDLTGKIERLQEAIQRYRKERRDNETRTPPPKEKDKK